MGRSIYNKKLNIYTQNYLPSDKNKWDYWNQGIGKTRAVPQIDYIFEDKNDYIFEDSVDFIMNNDKII